MKQLLSAPFKAATGESRREAEFTAVMFHNILKSDTRNINIQYIAPNIQSRMNRQLVYVMNNAAAGIAELPVML